MKLKYIKSNGVYYYPQKAGEKDNSDMIYVNKPVCIIKKLLFGRWQIDYFCNYTQFNDNGGYSPGDEDTPNTRLILYPSGIEEIRYV